jgi:predicted amidohydrolase YtcJ
VPDLLVAGRIHTLDARRPLAGAALLRDGRFARVGGVAECAREARPGARRIDVPCAVPGLCDAHGHPYALGRWLAQVDLRGARSAAECVERVAARARGGEGWLEGSGWDQNRWPGGALPTAAALDAAVPDRPVLLLRIDGHAGWANSRALAAAGIGAATPDPPGGRIERDARGAPAGVLVDAALERLRAAMPRPSPPEVERDLAAGLAALVAAGLTEVHDAGVTPEVLAAYRRLAAGDRLPVRAYVMLDGQAPLPELDARIAARGPAEQGRLTVRAVKLFADGALGSRGAALFAPYSDDPGTRGLLLVEPDELRERIRRIARAGLQPAVHAIGDRACHEVLAAFVEVGRELDLRPLRPRVEHLQIVAPADLPLLARAGAIASMQPVHARSDGPWVEARIGRERAAGAYAWRQALEAGARLAFGSDFPVEDPDPRAGLAVAAARLGPAEALAGFTSGAAFAAFAEHRRGAVAEGLDADLTLLGADPLAAGEALPGIPLLGTVVGGDLRLLR